MKMDTPSQGGFGPLGAQGAPRGPWASPKILLSLGLPVVPPLAAAGGLAAAVVVAGKAGKTGPGQTKPRLGTTGKPAKPKQATFGCLEGKSALAGGGHFQKFTKN